MSASFAEKALFGSRAIMATGVQKGSMGAEKNSSDGQFSLGYGWFAGYGKDLDVTLVILPDRAKIAQRITGDFPSGNSVSGMADALANDGVATPGGKPIRSDTDVRSI